MESERFRCNDCSNTYENKSSLRRYINTVQLNQRFICGHCQKAYMRNTDFLKHRIHCHQPVILQQGQENIQMLNNAPGQTTTCKPHVSTSKGNPQAKFDINTTNTILEGTTDWEQLLRRDLELSDDDRPKLISRSTITDKKFCPDAPKSCNTSPLGILDIRDTC